MMLVRAILGNWHLELVEPTMEVHQTTDAINYDFAALVPLQVSAMLKSAEGTSLLNGIKKIIIGGAPVSQGLEAKIQNLQAKCFHTYGMTETVSHIGLKALNGPQRSDWFHVVGENNIRHNNQGCLEINGAVTNNEWVVTNDLVDIKDNKFKWLGRADLIANSGGVKILIEEVENGINRLLPAQLSGTILIWKRNHSELGEELIGIATNQKVLEYIESHNEDLKQGLPKYHLPKHWFSIPSFLFTESGKIDRPATASLVNL